MCSLYPDKRYLFELGTGRYSSGSIPWLLTAFRECGLEFDAIYDATLAIMEILGFVTLCASSPTRAVSYFFSHGD